MATAKKPAAKKAPAKSGAKKQNTVSHAKREAAKSDSDPTKAKGRPPSPISKDIQDEILDWVSLGGTIRAYSRQPGKPGYVTIYDWLMRDSVFSERFAKSREVGHDCIAEETLEIIDQEPRMIVDAQNVARYDSAHVAWNKNRVEQRLKLLAKWNPKKYGEKVEVENKHSGQLDIRSVSLIPLA